MAVLTDLAKAKNLSIESGFACLCVSLSVCGNFRGRVQQKLNSQLLLLLLLPQNIIFKCTKVRRYVNYIAFLHKFQLSGFFFHFFKNFLLVRFNSLQASHLCPQPPLPSLSSYPIQPSKLLALSMGWPNSHMA